MNNSFGESSNPPPSLPEKKEGLGKYFPLNPNQIDRAHMLGYGDGLIRNIQERMIQGLGILAKLKCHPVAYETVLYMTQGLKNADLPEDAGLNERVLQIEAKKRIEAIREVIPEIFSKDTIASGSVFIAPYYMGPEHKDRFLYIFGLLFMWQKLGENNKCFARIPTTREYKAYFGGPQQDGVSKEGIKAWGSFTGYKERGSYYQYAIGYDGDTVKKIHMVREIDTKTIPPVFSSLGDIEPKVGVPAPESDIAYLEEQYILFGPIDTHPPYKKVMEAFLRKHKDYFLRGISSRCGWVEGRKFLERLQNEIGETRNIESTGEKNKSLHREKRKPALLPGPGSSPYHPLPTIPTERTKTKNSITGKKYPKPEIYGGFQNILRGGNPYRETGKKTVSNLPENSLLWMGRSGKTPFWQKYRGDEIVEIEPIGDSTTFYFCISEEDYPGEEAPEESEKYPQIRLTIIPRLSHTPSTSLPHRPEIVRTKVQTEVTEVISMPVENLIATVVDKTDELSIELLEIMEKVPEGIIISTEHSENGKIEGVFQSTPIVHFTLDRFSRTLELGPNNLPGVHIKQLERDLSSVFGDFITGVLRLSDTLFIEQFTPIKHKLSYIIGQITQDIPSNDSDILEIDDILFHSEINGRYGGDIFMGALHRGKFAAIQTILQGEGIHVSLKDDSPIRGKNYSLIVSIGTPSNTNGTYRISRQDHFPRYTLSREGAPFSEMVDIELRSIALNLYVLFALLGKQVFLSQPGKMEGKRKQFTLEYIEKVLQGNHDPSTNQPLPLLDSEKSLIHQAAQRVKQGNLKVSQGPSSEYRSGIMIPHIITARGIMEFHKLEEHDEIVLTDTRFTCIDDEKAVQIEEKWGKRKRKHPYNSTYAILKYHLRSRKYLVRRMIATLMNEQFRGLSPLSNRMELFLHEFFGNIPETTKKEFLLAVAGKGGHAGKGLQIQLPDGRLLFDAFIEEADEKKIPLIYAKPKTLPKSTIIHYIQSEDYKLWLKTLSSETPNIEEIRGK